MDFREISNIIFEQKYLYKTISDKDKADAFYMINKKLSLGKLKISQFFNSKFTDKASALDMWFLYLKKQNGLPSFWWSKSNNKKPPKKISGPDRKILLEHMDLTEDNLDFLIDNYLEDVQYELKKLKRFNNIK